MAQTATLFDFDLQAAGAVTLTTTSGTILTLGSTAGASSGIASSLGNLIRHQRYGYSTAYTAVYIGDSARGVGFGVDPNTIAGGQFSGDNRDCFFRRGVNVIVPNAGSTDWECALRISSGFGVANNPTVDISTTGIELSAVAGGVINVGSTSATSIQTAGGVTATSLSIAADTDASTILGRARVDSRVSDLAYFSHYDMTATDQYALVQTPTGGTAVNAASGQTVTIAIAGSSVILASSSEVTLSQPLKLANTAVAATPTPTHTITIVDAAGTTYRIPCVV